MSKFIGKTTFALSLALASMAIADAYADEPVQKSEAQITVNGHGESAIAPDLAIVTLSVAKSAETAKEALSQNSAAMDMVLKSLKDGGVAEKDLQTSQFSIVPQYIYPQNDDGQPKPPRLTGYVVTNAVTARVRNVSKLGELIDAAVSQGVNQGGEISFTNADPKAALSEARKAAVKDALEKARTIADAGGLKLGRVVSLSEINTQSRQLAGDMSFAKQRAEAVPLASGENTYAVDVSLSIAIGE